MGERPNLYQPRALLPLSAMSIAVRGESAGEVELAFDYEESDEPKTFGELIRAIVMLVKRYWKGRKK